MKKRSILLFRGLPGSGKTTAADMMQSIIGGARINADQIRSSISNDLKFTDDDRLVQAYRLGAITGVAIKDPLAYPQEVYADRGHLNTTAIVDFVCPTESTLDAFCQMAYWHAVPTISITVILMDTITPDQCRFSDTAKLFDPLTRNKVHVTRWETPDLLKMKMTELARHLGYLEGGKQHPEKSVITV